MIHWLAVMDWNNQGIQLVESVQALKVSYCKKNTISQISILLTSYIEHHRNINAAAVQHSRTHSTGSHHSDCVGLGVAQSSHSDDVVISDNHCATASNHTGRNSDLCPKCSATASQESESSGSWSDHWIFHIINSCSGTRTCSETKDYLVYWPFTHTCIHVST